MTKHWRKAGVGCSSNFLSSCLFQTETLTCSHYVNILTLFSENICICSQRRLITQHCSVAQNFFFFFLAVYLHALLDWIFKKKINRGTNSNPLLSLFLENDHVFCFVFGGQSNAPVLRVLVFLSMFFFIFYFLSHCAATTNEIHEDVPSFGSAAESTWSPEAASSCHLAWKTVYLFAGCVLPAARAAMH